jgi:glycine/D-amino acid oxidase-like deaminating enzyme
VASASADAIVIGAGICGASAAYFLAERGVDVLVLDRSGISQGTTGRGEGNVLVCDKRPGPERDLALRGRGLWELLGQQFPAARVTRKGALVLDHPDGSDAGTLEPALAPGTRALLEPGDLQVDPAGTTRTLLSDTRIRVRVRAEVAGVAGGRVTLSTGDRVEAMAARPAARRRAAHAARCLGEHRTRRLRRVSRPDQRPAAGPTDLRATAGGRPGAV